MLGVLLGLSLAGHAEPVGQDAAMAADEPTQQHPALPIEEHPDAAVAAERAAIDALLHGQARSDRQAVLLQTYLERPPTWIQHAARVNLAEFPHVDDPTADAERHFDNVAWLAEQRLLAPPPAARAAGADRGGDIIPVFDEPTWFDLLLPSTWLPFVRENRDAIVAAGAALLLSAWALKLLTRRLVARAARRRRRRRHSSGHERSGRAVEGAPGTSRALHDAGTDRTDERDREARRRLRRRRRHRHRSGTRVTANVPSAEVTAGS